MWFALNWLYKFEVPKIKNSDHNCYNKYSVSKVSECLRDYYYCIKILDNIYILSMIFTSII